MRRWPSIGSSATLWQYHLTFGSAAREGIRQKLVRIRSAATGAFVFAGAAANLVRLFLEV